MRIVLSFLLLCGIVLAEQTVRVPVWTEHDRPLAKTDVVAESSGESLEVVGVLGPENDLVVLLVLDLVEDINEIDLAKAGLEEAISEAASNVYFSVLRAQDGLKVLVDPTDDRDKVIEAIHSAPGTGTPGLLETIEIASELADSVISDAAVRVALFYVTDSEIDEYREDFTNPVVNRSDRGDMSRRFPEGLIRDRISRLDTKLAARQSPIFIVHLEYETDRLDEAYQNGLLQMAATTGGHAVFCRSNAEIGTAISEMLTRITRHHSVELRVRSDSPAIRVSLESETGPLAYRSRYRLSGGQ